MPAGTPGAACGRAAHARTPDVPAGLDHVPELDLGRGRVGRQARGPLHPAVVHHLPPVGGGRWETRCGREGRRDGRER